MSPGGVDEMSFEFDGNAKVVGELTRRVVDVLDISGSAIFVLSIVPLSRDVECDDIVELTANPSRWLGSE